MRDRPAVGRDGDTLHVAGFGHLTHAQALALVRKLADELTP
jgi:acyl CoA:acetate/3-ketoacid CoA transferase alpha subunit